MIQNIILEELERINQTLDVCISQMDDILRSKARNVMWRMFFPAGQFMQQKTLARKTSLEILKIDTQLKEMEQVLERLAVSSDFDLILNNIPPLKIDNFEVVNGKVEFKHSNRIYFILVKIKFKKNYLPSESFFFPTKFKDSELIQKRLVFGCSPSSNT